MCSVVALSLSPLCEVGAIMPWRSSRGWWDKRRDGGSGGGFANDLSCQSLFITARQKIIGIQKVMIDHIR